MHGNTCAGHEPSKPPALSFEAVTKRFGAPTVIDDLSIDIRQSEFFALLGPSGCGKSTLLRIAAGFERPNSGRVLIDGGDVTDMPPHLRPVNMMFQSYALFPHMSVAENIAFGLKQERCDRATITERVTQALALLQLAPLAQRRPDQLSGGQRQRVALARALVKRPRVLLLDEPLGALDKKLRDEMQGELAALQRRLGTTFVIVTHDQEEALTLADRIAVLDRGRIAQVGTPSEIYDRPASLSVARFMGDINLIEGRVAAADEDATTVDCGGIGRLAVAGRSGIPAGDAAFVAVRPELVGTGVPDGAPNAVSCTVTALDYRGTGFMLSARTQDGTLLRAALPARGTALPRPGDAVRLGWPAHAAVLLEP